MPRKNTAELISALTERWPDIVSSKDIGQRIKRLRAARGLTQTKLAERLGISFQQVQKYENGINTANVIVLQAIAKVLEIPVARFFEPQPQNKSSS